MTQPWEAHTQIRIDEATPPILQWNPYVIPAMVAAGVPGPFGMAWLAAESQGNTCAVGELTAVGPDGFPREIGPFKAYNPDDFKTLGYDPAEFVASCVHPAVGARQHKSDDGGYSDGTLPNPQHIQTPLTPSQMARHAQLGAALANLKRRSSDHYLSAWKVAWPTTSPDYWAAVKGYHAYPPIINTGIGEVTKHLGRPPTSWREYRSTYEIVQPLAKFDPAKAAAKIEQSPYYRGLDNAEWVGFHVQPQPEVA